MLKSSESSPACAPATGVADFSGEGLPGCRVIGAFLLSVFFLPNNEKNTRNYPPPGESAVQIRVSLYHFAQYNATLDVGDSFGRYLKNYPAEDVAGLSSSECPQVILSGHINSSPAPITARSVETTNQNATSRATKGSK